MVMAASPQIQANQCVFLRRVEQKAELNCSGAHLHATAKQEYIVLAVLRVAAIPQLTPFPLKLRYARSAPSSFKT